MSKPDLSSMADKWPSAIVSRNKIEAFTGGLITTNTMSNTDSGLPKHRRNRKVFYLVTDLIKWLEESSVTENTRTTDELLTDRG